MVPTDLLLPERSPLRLRLCLCSFHTHYSASRPKRRRPKQQHRQCPAHARPLERDQDVLLPPGRPRAAAALLVRLPGQLAPGPDPPSIRHALHHRPRRRHWLAARADLGRAKPGARQRPGADQGRARG